ncbi:Ig-like domain-containing protein [Deinococcus sp.]|uniref:Ig-like domain-containing protein n=1 Tax=Deinococcus sp. TaxID=47478 RepID=UPI002869A948|nr:Ig-like domain-containing protein [Deinococcus sp.]
MKAFIIAALIALFATSCGSMQAPAAGTQTAGQTVQGAATTATDTQAPKVSMMMFPHTLREEGNVFFQLSTKDNVNVAQVVLNIDGKAFVKDSTAHNSYAKFFAAQDNGTHTVTVQVYDSAHNVTEYTQDFQVDISK